MTTCFLKRGQNVEISTLHPDQAHIFRLWQIYLDNVNPLLKVTHTPTLQRRVIDAVVNLTNVKPTLEALMFSIYCVAVMSLEEATCQSTFGIAQKGPSGRLPARMSATALEM